MGRLVRLMGFAIEGFRADELVYFSGFPWGGVALVESSSFKSRFRSQLTATPFSKVP